MDDDRQLLPNQLKMLQLNNVITDQQHKYIYHFSSSTVS